MFTGETMHKLRVTPLTDRDLMEKIEDIGDKIDKNNDILQKLDSIETRLRNTSFVLWIFLSIAFAVASIFSSFINLHLFSLIFILIGSFVLIGVVIVFVISTKNKKTDNYNL